MFTTLTSFWSHETRDEGNFQRVEKFSNLKKNIDTVDVEGLQDGTEVKTNGESSLNKWWIIFSVLLFSVSPFVFLS